MLDSSKKLKGVIVQKILLIVITVFFISSSCSKKESSLVDCLTKEEIKDLDYFFRHLMIYNSGAFVLFGSKPLCDAGFLNDVAERDNSPYERNPMNGWKVWEKIKDHVHPHRYLIMMEQIERSINDEMRIYTHFVFIDVKKVAIVLAENYEVFKSYFGVDFHPLEVAFDFENPNSPFWKKIVRFDNSMTNGLLYGFGKNNALFWTWENEFKNGDGKIAEFFNSSPRIGSVSDNESMGFGFWTPETIEIPGFVVFEGNEIVEKYEKERERIKEIYKGRDFLEVTFQQLAKY